MNVIEAEVIEADVIEAEVIRCPKIRHMITTITKTIIVIAAITMIVAMAATAAIIF